MQPRIEYPAFDGKTVSDLLSWLNELASDSPARQPGPSSLFTGYYPADVIDLWPAYVIQKWDPRRRLEPLLIMPIGQMDQAEHRDLEQQMIRFLDTASINPQSTLARWSQMYDYCVKRICPLDPITEESSGRCLDLPPLGQFKGAYMQLSHTDYQDVHLLILEADPSDCWRIQSKLKRPIDILIESGKGMGNWFTDIPLYQYIALGPGSRIPSYYMKGKYMSYDGPNGTYREYEEYDPMISTEIRRIDSRSFVSGYHWTKISHR